MKTRSPGISKRWIALAFALILVLVRAVGWRSPTHHVETSLPPISQREAPPAVLEGLVVGISDGDTVTVLDASKVAHKIRLLGIDAPESNQRSGKPAKKALSDLIFQKQVQVFTKSADRYNRTLGKIQWNNEDINLEMVREGMAWHYAHYANDQFPGDAARYANAEREAREARRGLWRDPRPVEPWAWRQEHRTVSGL